MCTAASWLVGILREAGGGFYQMKGTAEHQSLPGVPASCQRENAAIPVPHRHQSRYEALSSYRLPFTTTHFVLFFLFGTQEAALVCAIGWYVLREFHIRQSVSVFATFLVKLQENTYI
jgi:hypothetical protein